MQNSPFRPLKKGDLVVHRIENYGCGTVRERWGSWPCCRTCNAETKPPNKSLCHVCGRPEVSKPIAKTTVHFRCQGCETIVGRPCVAFCPSCEKDRLVTQVTADEVYDVRFGLETISVYVGRLRCVWHAPEAPPEPQRPKKPRGKRGKYKQRNYAKEFEELKAKGEI